MKNQKLLLALASASFLLFRVDLARADLPVDDFEDVSDWSGLTLDNTTVHGGKGSGRWDDQLKKTSARKTFATAVDASASPLFRFWAHSKAANNAKIMLVLDSDNPADPAGWDYYSKTITVNWTGWKLFVLRPSDFSVSRNPIGWNKINYVSFNASGWDLTPQADTVITFDDMAFGTPIVDAVRQQQAWVGTDFRYDFFVTLKDLADTQRNLSLSVETQAGFPFKVSLPKSSVSLAAKASEEVTVSITIPASAISPSTQLNLHSAALQISENNAVIEQEVFDAAVPTPHRAHPRTLLDSSDFTRIETWAKTNPWADAARSSIVSSADSWLDRFKQKYGLAEWALPKEGGQWTHYYVCPKHGVKLNYAPPMSHACSLDQEKFTGWPYDQVIYSWIHSDLANAAQDSALAYRLTGNTTYAQSAAAILIAYADKYLSYPLHDSKGNKSSSAAHVLAQTLDESGWLINMAVAYDLIADTGVLTPAQAKHIEDELIRAAAATIHNNPSGMSNWQSWHNAAISAAGFSLEDPTLISQALRDQENGFEYQMKTSVTADGFWYEGSWGYHFYALSAISYMTEMATRAGLDVYSNAALKSMFLSPVLFAMPNGDLPSFNDSGASSLLGQTRLFETALRRWNDPSFAAALQGSNRGRDALLFGAETVPKASAVKLKSALFPNAGYAVLRSGEGKLQSYLALDFGPHGGGHGHYDKLGFVYYGRESVLGIDPGTQPYAAPTHATWDKMSVAHNTIVVDEKSQVEATGKLHQFVSMPLVSMAVADSGGAYKSAKLLRTMLTTPEYAIDRFHASATDSAAHNFDYVLHAPGKAMSPLAMTPYSSFPKSDGYQHLSSCQSAESEKPWSALFQQDTAAGNVGSAWTSKPEITASLSYSNEQAATGAWSAKATYDFSKSQGSALYSLNTPKVPEELPSELRFKLFGDKSLHKLSVRFNDATDERFVQSVATIDWTGWKDISATSPETWSHFLGNNDGLIDLPIKSITIQIDSAANGPLASFVYIDDISLKLPKSGDYLIQDFELTQSNLSLMMAGSAGTRVVLGTGLGPNLTVPVPFAMARRSAQDTVFQSLLEPYGDKPTVTSFETLPTQAPEALAASVRTDSYSDSVFAVADIAAVEMRNFGDSSCDGLLCFIRKDNATSTLRFAGAKLTRLSDGKVDLLLSDTSLETIQTEYLSDSTLLAIEAGAAISSKLRIWGPKITQVTLNSAPTSFVRDGDYVLLNFVPSQDAGTDASVNSDASAQDAADEASGGSSADNSDGCGCSVPGKRNTNEWLILAALGILAGKVRRRKYA